MGSLGRMPRKQKIDWTEEQAIDLITQGYSYEYAAKTSGYSIRWLLEQRIPREPLSRRVLVKR